MAIGTCSRITTQRDLRRAFWSVHDQFDNDRRAGAPYRATVRTAWVDFIDAMCRAGVITEALAGRAVLGETRPAGPPALRTAKDIVAAIDANVADVNAGRIDWEEFTRRQFRTWDAVADRPRLHDRVLSLLRT